MAHHWGCAAAALDIVGIGELRLGAHRRHDERIVDIKLFYAAHARLRRDYRDLCRDDVPRIG
ncbi:MAG: hypothetical protein ACM3SS_10505 [Rhodospirillaceae bacterium]